ncbi:MAG: glycerol-3-phosphate 1-O-acyltransferase PlsY [Clostridia bacterium]|nr:glycerol-3-phosphate 1-O-acyltransferase PlsY [Clostridia bacterium]MBQ8235345.1 glycerol-3-phosphate 1-O-acyltransferase PlsY [Clostridia bacterium]MBQ8398995.1 glycerol-3-phosphate 1-O-acyltransferase PlsY [Clostridia bacterium]
MKRKSIAALFLVLVLILGLSLGSFAQTSQETSGAVSDESAAVSPEEESASQTSKEEPIRQPEPTGIGKIVNGYISLCEKGGLVTKAFGTWTESVAKGTDGKLYYVTTPTLPPVMYPVTLVICFVAAYLMGSINFGVIISKKMCNDDVRNHGSGNAGMTNVMRVHGKKPAILTLLGDAGKAMLSALFGLLLAGNGAGYLALAGCMIGHAFPIFFKFKGGKAVACAAGGMLILEPLALLILMAFFVIIVLGTKYVSLGSVIAGLLIPVMVDSIWQFSPVHNMGNPDVPMVMICSVFYACFLAWLHRANIKRLYQGEERKTDLIRDLFKKKKQEKN